MFRSLRGSRGGALIRALPALVCLVGLAPAAAAGIAPLPVIETASGVFVHLGRHEETTAANRGDIANIGFIVGEKCVAVVDSGGSLALGLALKAAVRAKTDRPVCFVINTHMHPDHVFGNAAFADPADAYVPARLVGSARLPAALATRGGHYRAALSAALGEGAEGSRVVPPDLLVEGELRLDLGGRVLVLRTWPTAHTNNDLTVFDEATGTLWLGDLLFERRIPALDGSIKGWLAVIQQLRDLPARQVIPGHGGLGLAWPAALDAQARYLEHVAGKVRSALDRGRSLHETVNAVNPAEAAEAAGWQLAEFYHRRNVTAAYAELEWEK